MYLKANASAAGPPLKYWGLQSDSLGGHLGCKVISWGLREWLLMFGGVQIWNFWATKWCPGGLLERLLMSGGTNWRCLDCKMNSWRLWERFLMSGGSKLEAFGLQNELLGPVGEAFEGHGAQDAHFGGPNGQKLKNLRFLKVFRGTQIWDNMPIGWLRYVLGG